MDNSKMSVLENVCGEEDKSNTVLHWPPQQDDARPSASSSPRKHVIFFPGDVQDFEKDMKENPTAKEWSQWSFERTLEILSDKFKSSHIWLITPAKKIYRIFCIYKNFVKSESLFGVPDHEGDYEGLLHLKKLFFNLLRQECSEEIEQDYSISLIGFSKGCIVLNQFLHEVAWYTKNFESYDGTQKMELRNFIGNICELYWLDGGHSGQKDVWVRSKDILTPLKDGLWSKRLKLYIHVTPYQMKDPIHPWKGEEEAEFITGLCQLKVDFVEKLHFDEEDTEPGDFNKEDLLAKHFQVIQKF